MILVVAGAWRLALAVAMPCISRDGAMYCWFARDLGVAGLDLLAGDEYQQHPLFPVAILGVERLLYAAGAGATPMLWQRAGQCVAWFSGMAVVVVSGVLAGRLTRRLKLTVDPRQVALCAMSLAALLPLNTWLSADVMSDQLHLAFYLAGVVFLLGLERWPMALACGLCSGLAFLTRPEGAVVCCAGLLSLAVQLRRRPVRRLVGSAALVLVGLGVCALPYWIVSGKLSPKLDKQLVAREPPAAEYAARHERHVATGVQRASLLTRDVSWYALVPGTLYTTFRAGRIVIPLLAIAPLIHLRRRLRLPPLAGVLACMGMHFALATYLLHRWRYLEPRHVLVVVALLLPFAAMFFMHLLNNLPQLGRWATTGALAAVCFAPLGFYSLRVPNGADAFIARAAGWLAKYDPAASAKLLLGGSSQRRVAFYADMRLQPWPENEPEFEVRLAALRAHILHNRPEYFAIETGTGREREGNQQLLQRLVEDEQAGYRMREIHVEHNAHGGALHVVAFDWAGE